VAACSSSQLSSQQGTVDKSKTDNESIRQKNFIRTNIGKVVRMSQKKYRHAERKRSIPWRRPSIVEGFFACACLAEAPTRRLTQKSGSTFFDFILLCQVVDGSVTVVHDLKILKNSEEAISSSQKKYRHAERKRSIPSRRSSIVERFFAYSCLAEAPTRRLAQKSGSSFFDFTLIHPLV